MYVKEKLKEKKGCRRFYDIMTQAFKMESENKWSQELGLINEQE